jgi:hypothetical protein
MQDRRPQRNPRQKVVCPACQGLGRYGPEGAMCRVCWLTGVIDSSKYERIKAEQARRRGEVADAPSDADGHSAVARL